MLLQIWIIKGDKRTEIEELHPISKLQRNINLSQCQQNVSSVTI